MTIEVLAAEVAALKEQLAKQDAHITALAASLKDHHAALKLICAAPAIRMALGIVKIAELKIVPPDASGEIVSGAINPEAARVKAAAGLTAVYEARHDAVGAKEAGRR